MNFVNRRKLILWGLSPEDGMTMLVTSSIYPERAYIYFTASVNQQNRDSINALSAVPLGSR